MGATVEGDIGLMFGEGAGESVGAVLARAVYDEVEILGLGRIKGRLQRFASRGSDRARRKAWIKVRVVGRASGQVRTMDRPILLTCLLYTSDAADE